MFVAEKVLLLLVISLTAQYSKINVTMQKTNRRLVDMFISFYPPYAIVNIAFVIVENSNEMLGHWTGRGLLCDNSEKSNDWLNRHQT